MINPCPFPVEVVSLDWDPQYLADEDNIRALGDSRFSGDWSII
jgi:hydrocephalus-inducing protein